jgi:RNA polymerase sigma-70 factor (ECF subfamily)
VIATTATSITSSAAPAAGDALGALLDAHRVELTGYCYRMLGSAAEADDAVQETLVRAWRYADRFEGRAALRSWLYRIATNVCFAASNGRRRRALPVDLGPSSSWGEAPHASVPEATWIEPVPDDRVLPPLSPGDPAERAVARESIRLAFVAALQHLPPRQRAVLILREVLRWRASEVAELLDTSVVSVNSALQRARETLAARGAEAGSGPTPAAEGLDEVHRELLARYVDAFERYDIDLLVTLLHEDATVQMPPIALWLQGPGAVLQAARADREQPCRGSRLVPVAANGAAAFAQYRPGRPRGSYQPWALQVVEVAGGRITTITSFLDAATLFPRFGLRNIPE